LDGGAFRSRQDHFVNPVEGWFVYTGMTRLIMISLLLGPGCTAGRASPPPGTRAAACRADALLGPASCWTAWPAAPDDSVRIRSGLQAPGASSRLVFVRRGVSASRAARNARVGDDHALAVWRVRELVEGNRAALGIAPRTALVFDLDPLYCYAWGDSEFLAQVTFSGDGGRLGSVWVDLRGEPTRIYRESRVPPG
jgi:hypothetical protein